MMKLVTWVATVMTVAITTSAMFVGCLPLVEINIVQRVINDVGDDTKDGYSNVDESNRTEDEQLRILVPLK